MKISLFNKFSEHIDVVLKGCSSAVARLKGQVVESRSWGSIRGRFIQLLEFISVFPGLVLVFCSLYTLLVPTEWFFSLLIFTFSCGVVGTIVAIQAVLLKRKTYEVIRDIKGGIMIQAGGGVTEEQLINLIESSVTKVTLH
jgi:hypothetical protein